MSVEEQLIRERMRNTSLGITSFTFDAVYVQRATFLMFAALSYGRTMHCSRCSI
jgi:hypothetical protein